MTRLTALYLKYVSDAEQDIFCVLILKYEEAFIDTSLLRVITR